MPGWIYTLHIDSNIYLGIACGTIDLELIAQDRPLADGSIDPVMLSATKDAQYAGGIAYRNQELAFLSANYIDMNFRTYVDAAHVPSTVWLFGSSLLGLVAVTKRKTVKIIYTIRADSLRIATVKYS